MAKILVVDDERSIRRILRDILETEKYQVEEASNGLECMVKLKQDKFDVVILDIKMDKPNGLVVLERMQEMQLETPVVMISGHGDIDTAVEAVKKGAFDFIQKPLDLNRLLITLRNAMDKSNLISEKKVLQKKVRKGNKTQEIIGESNEIKKIMETIQTVGPTDARVLVTGENGTGKELVAKWIHDYSNRKDSAIVEVNCAAIPSELIESELFGHDKGAFTSAHKVRTGKFEQANGGTLFLDEIGDMSLAAQAKVLRALQENKITKVGGNKDISVDVRVIAATNKDLRKEIAKGHFREDLYHRISTIVVRVPSLNERLEDIPILVEYFNKMICKEYNIPEKSFATAAIKELQTVNWTGNIRELRNVVERLIILSKNNISKQDVIDFVKPSSNKRSEMETLFEKYDSFTKLTKFLEKEYDKYKAVLF